MKPTVEGLSQDFTQLVGPEAIAKAVADIAAAKAAADAAAKAAAEKAAAAAAAAKAAAATATPAPPPPVAAAPVARPPTSIAAAVPVAARPAPASGSPAATPVSPSSRPAAPTTPRPIAPAAAAPAQIVIPAMPVRAESHAAKGCDFDATVAPGKIVAAAQIMDRDGFALDTITGVDWIAQNEMEVVYDFFHPTASLRAVVRTRVPRATPEVPSITAVYPGANWHERETHDFFGIRFQGHPNLKPFLLPEDANFHPLRKDYQS